MTVLSRLFRQTPPSPPTLPEQLDALRAQPEALANAARTAADEELRLAAIGALPPGAALYALAGLTPGEETPARVRRAARQRIATQLDAGTVRLADLQGPGTDIACLLAIAGNAADQSLLPQLVASVDDEATLCDLAIQGATPALRRLAAERVYSPAAVGRLLKEAQGKDKNVYRILKAKRDAQHAEERAAAEAEAAMHTLAGTIERHSHQPFSATYASTVDFLAAQWDAAAHLAPEELRLRTAAAVERCRGVITRHLQQVASAAAQAAAAENAALQRQAMLTRLRELLAGLFADGTAGAAAAAELEADSLAARWEALAPISPAARDAAAAFAELRRAVTGLARFNAEHGAVVEFAGTLDGPRAALLQAALAHAAPLGEPVPEAAQAAADGLRAWEEATARAAEQQASALRQVQGLLRRAQSSLKAGNSRPAAGMRRSIEEKLANLETIPAGLATQLQSFDQQLGALQDWRSFAVAPKRGELIAQMEALIGSEEPPAALAEQIHRLQEEWKLISKGATEDTSAEWQRFHEAAQKAYEPCKLHFAAQAQQRAANLEKRAALLARLQAFVAAQTWEQTDWREVARALRESRQQWRAHQPVERAANKPLQEQFDALSADLQARLDAEYARNAEAKRALIARAQKLLTAADAAQATEEIKKLQHAWQMVGLVAPAESQSLWEEFRRQCDAAFARRQQAQVEFSDQLKSRQAAAEALCAEVEALRSLTGNELIEAVRRGAELRAAFAAIGELPRSEARRLPQRFERAIDALEQGLARQRVREQSLAWNQVLDAADLIRAWRLVAGTGASEDAASAPHQAAAEYVAAVTRLPKNVLQALRAELANVRATDTGSNADALRSLCIRAELLTDTPTPAGDHALRREFQLRQLASGFGQARATGREAFESLLLEWLSVGATTDAAYAELLARFKACGQRCGVFG